MFAIYGFYYHKTYMYTALVGRTLQEHHKYVERMKVKFHKNNKLSGYS
jgi:hypothetical protein